MPEEVNDQSRGPDGRFRSSNPDPTDAGTASGSAATLSPPASDGGDLSAPKESPRDEALRVFNELTAAGTTSDDGGASSQQNGSQPATRETMATPSTAAPGNQEPPAGQPSTTTATTETTQTAPAPATAKPYADYAGAMDRKTGDLLKSVGLLPPPEQWKDMSAVEQVEHVNACRRLRNENNAAFARQRDAGDTAPTPTDDGSQGQGVAARGGRQEFSGQADSQSPQPAQAGGAVRLPPVVEQHLARLAEVYGADSPEYAVQRSVAEAQFTHFQQAQRATQLLVAQQQQEQQWRSFEDSVVQEFAEQAALKIAPKDLDGPQGIRAQARAYCRANRENGNEIDPKEAVEFVLKSRFYPEISRRQNERLEQQRKKSLAGSVERGTAPQQATGKNPAANSRQAAKEAFDRLAGLAAQGIEGAAALAQM